MQRSDPDRAVDRHDAGSIAQDFVGRATVQRYNAIGDAIPLRQPGDKAGPVDQPVIERVHDNREFAHRITDGVGGDDPLDRLADITERRVRADLVIGGELQRHQKIRAGRPGKPLLCRTRRRRTETQPEPRPQPAGIFGERVAEAVIAVIRIEHPPEHQPEIVGDIERGDQPERRMKPRAEIGVGKLLGQGADGLRVTREARIGRHPVMFEGDPIRPDIAEIGRDHRDAAHPRLFRGDDVVRAAVAMQHQVGDLMLVECAGDIGAPIGESAAKMRRRQPPEQLVAEMQVDAVHTMPARDQRLAEPAEEI